MRERLPLSVVLFQRPMDTLREARTVIQVYNKQSGLLFLTFVFPSRGFGIVRKVDPWEVLFLIILQ